MLLSEHIQVKSCSPQGKLLAQIMEKGDLVPMETLLDLVLVAMMEKKGKTKGYLIDGFPREAAQGPLFEKKIATVTFLIFFEASEEVLVSRLMNRAADSGRSDDNEETIKTRVEVFNANNSKVLEVYGDRVITVRKTFRLYFILIWSYDFSII